MSATEAASPNELPCEQRISDLLGSSESGVALGGRLSSTDGQTVVLRNRALLASLAQAISLAGYDGGDAATVRRMIGQFRPSEGELSNIGLWGVGGGDLSPGDLIDLTVEACAELEDALSAAVDGKSGVVTPSLEDRIRLAIARLIDGEAQARARELAAVLETADGHVDALYRRAADLATGDGTPAVYRTGRKSPDILARELRNARDTLMHRDLEHFAGVRSAANTVRRILSFDAPEDNEDGRAARSACLALLDLAEAVVSAPGINPGFDRMRGGPLGMAMSTVELVSSTKSLIAEARQARMQVQPAESGGDEAEEAA